MIIVTTNNIPCFSIIENLGVIAANQVVGANVIADFIASFSDFFGGTSGAYRDKLDQLFLFAKKQLTEKALSIGANAILGFKIEYDEISGKGKSMFMVTCIGTAVVIVPNVLEKLEKLHKLNLFYKDGLLSADEYEKEKVTIKDMYDIKIIDVEQNFLERSQNDDVDNHADINQIVVDEVEEMDSIEIPNIDANLKKRISNVVDNIWMMSEEGIEQCDAPSFVKGNNLDQQIINLICNSRFNEAGKLYCMAKKVNAEQAYNFIMTLCLSASE